MEITKIISTEVDTGNSAGTATSISDATCVRLFNNQTGIVTVGISTLVGAATTNFFTMPGSSVEFLQKTSTDVIWTSAVIKANKVAFTN
jgi:hypothetical protein